MGSGHRTSKVGGKACGSKCKAVVPSHGEILARKKKNAMRKIILATGYALRIVRVSTNHTMTRNQIAASIIKSRNENTFAEFVAQHPTTTGIGAWRYSCDRAGWHSFTVCKAMETFGKAENLAWRVAGKNTNVTLEELLVDAAANKDADAAAEIESKISKEERKNPGTICSTVKAACEKAGVFFNRTSHENQYSTNLVFTIGEQRVRFDYCGGAMMKVSCGPTQLMGLVAAFLRS